MNYTNGIINNVTVLTQRHSHLFNNKHHATSLLVPFSLTGQHFMPV